MLLLGVTPHISYDYYSPKPGATNHTSLATFSIPLSLRSTTQQISVCQPSPVPLSMSSMPAVESVPPHLSSNTALLLLFTQTRCYQPYLPCNILHLSISKYLYNQWWRPMCDVFVQFVFISDPGPLSAVWSFPPHLYLMVTTHHDQYSARSRCLSPCPPYQLLEVSQHTSTSW